MLWGGGICKGRESGGVCGEGGRVRVRGGSDAWQQQKIRKNRAAISAVWEPDSSYTNILKTTRIVYSTVYIHSKYCLSFLLLLCLSLHLYIIHELTVQCTNILYTLYSCIMLHIFCKP